MNTVPTDIRRGHFHMSSAPTLIDSPNEPVRDELVVVEDRALPVPSEAIIRVPWWRRHLVLLLLCAFTLIGGALRFTALDRPSLWGDEAATYRRISGTYRQLLDSLRDAWFPPLHYQLYFWLSRHIPMDPFGMRLMPAIAGTLMIPAMYFLARQLVSVRDSLTAAGFTAISAYLLAYSRDGKMYMELWLFVALSTACLMWWVRTSRSTAFLAWVASAAAMVGLHGMGFAVLGLHVVFFLTGRRVTGWKTLALVIGLTITVAGDAVHYGAFNVVGEQIEQRGWGASGIDWTDTRNRDQPTPLIVADTASAFLFSFLWIQEKPPGTVVPGLPTVMAWMLGSILALLLVGAMPWSHRLRGTSLVSDFSRIESPWRTGLWLTIWLVVPAYAIYCASNNTPVSPAYWIDSLSQLIHGRWWVLLGCIVSACALTQVSQWAWRAIAIVIPLGVLWALGDALLRPGAEANTDWVIRWGYRLTQPWLFGGLLGATAAIWFDRAGETVGQRLLVSLRFALVVAAVLVLCIVLHAGIEGYFARRGHVMGREMGQEVGRKSIWMPRWLAIVWPAVAIVVAVLFMRLPTRPLRWSAIACFVALNLAQFTGRLTAGTEAPMARIATDIIAGSPKGDGTVVTFVQPGHGGAAPGMASIQDHSGSYYLYRLTNTKSSPLEFLQNQIWGQLNVRSDVAPDRIAADVNGSPAVKRLVVWNYYRGTTPIKDDGLRLQLGPDWLPAGDEVHPVRTFWNWAQFYRYQRREFVRVDR